MKNKNFVLSKLILLEKLPPEKTIKPSWKRDKTIYNGRFLCFCGQEFVCRLSSVKNGNTKSCGCYHKNTIIKHVGWKTRLYSIFMGMHTRCGTKTNTAYKNYGGRGITVCKEWNTFSVFRKWAFANGYQEHLSIDRINNDGKYEPGNCRWVTVKIQSINKRNKKTNTSGSPGVSKTKNGRYQVDICLGTYATIEEAASIYEQARKERDNRYLKEEGLL